MVEIRNKRRAHRPRWRSERAIILALMLPAALGCSPGGGPALTVGDQVPALELPRLDGAPFERRSGAPLLVNFWATWCEACKAILPELRRLDLDGDIGVLGIALDEDVATVRSFAVRHELAYPLALDDGRLFERFGGLTLPYSVLLSGEGEVLAVYRGALRPKAMAETLGAGDRPS